MSGFWSVHIFLPYLAIVIHSFSLKERMALYFSKYPAGVTIMNSYLFARQLNKDQWAKMDYDDAHRTGLTNLGEYNQVRKPP